MAIMDLNPYELALYCNYKQTASDHGECYKSNKTLAAETQMSVSQVKRARQGLKEKGYIVVEERITDKGEHLTTMVTIVDVWNKNHRRYHGNNDCGEGVGSGRAEGSVLSEPRSVLVEPQRITNKEEIKDAENSVNLSAVNRGTSPSSLYGYSNEPINPDRSGKPVSEQPIVEIEDPAFPEVGHDVIRLLERMGGSPTKRLSAAQVKRLTSAVVVPGKGTCPSPEEERQKNAVLWERFIDRIPEMPAAKHLIRERKVTTGEIIKLICGYHYKGGWHSYKYRVSPSPVTGGIDDYMQVMGFGK